ncbi:hypothetical protein BH20ACT9_BH20ACT9_19760 [soil metagenome]
MQSAATTVSPEGLTVQRPLEHLSIARGRVRQLAAIARALTGDGTGDPGRCGCGRGPCAFSGVPGGAQACALLPPLSRLQPGDPPRETGAGLRARYLRLLADSSGSVLVCRRFLHSEGRCLYLPDGAPGSLCGRVLAASHRLGERRRRQGSPTAAGRRR